MDLSVLPVRQLLRWDLTARVLVALLLPLLLGYLRTGTLSGLLPALVAAAVSMSYLGPDLGIFRWSVFAAVGTTITALVGTALATGDLWGRLLFIFLLMTALGSMLLAGITTQVAFGPIAIIGLITTVLLEIPVTWELVYQVVGGAALGLALIATVPHWSAWPRIPLPPGALQPDTDLLRRMWTRPSLHDWAFPVLLGVLAVAVLVIASVLGQGDRPYWAVLALITVLGPQRQRTLEEGWRTLVAALIGVAAALVLLLLPLTVLAVVLIAFAIGALGALVLLSHSLLSKAALTVMLVVLISLLASDDALAVGQERFIETAIGVAAAILAAGLAEYLSVRMEQRHPEPIDPPVEGDEAAQARA